MNGTTFTGSSSLGAATLDWRIAGVGDVDGDGRTDLLWRHPLENRHGLADEGSSTATTVGSSRVRGG
jgi:hypothetical protein